MVVKAPKNKLCAMIVSFINIQLSEPMQAPLEKHVNQENRVVLKEQKIS